MSQKDINSPLCVTEQAVNLAKHKKMSNKGTEIKAEGAPGPQRNVKVVTEEGWGGLTPHIPHLLL